VENQSGEPVARLAATLVIRNVGLRLDGPP
jgi:hypothetical protein